MKMTTAQLAPGAILGDKYRLVAHLGAGGMGTVWRAQHLQLQSEVAVKIVQETALSSPDALARFLREPQSAAALRSPHVVHIMDYGVHHGAPFIVMELLVGETLSDRQRRVGRLAPAETARVVTHVARAIARAHEAGVVHRDLKPDNVFLVRNADDEIAKVLDFGIAKVADAGPESVGPETRTGMVLGTPYYMSPEQARGQRAVDHRADLWSLGVIAYECMTGHRPFESHTLADLMVKICAEPLPVPSTVAAVPQGFDAWFQRATQRDPEQRFQSALEMADALRRLIPDAATTAAGEATLAAAQVAPQGTDAQPATALSSVFTQPPARPRSSTALPWVMIQSPCSSGGPP